MIKSLNEYKKKLKEFNDHNKYYYDLNKQKSAMKNLMY